MYQEITGPVTGPAKATDVVTGWGWATGQATPPTFICLDTETTGVSDADRLCQVAYIAVNPEGREMTRVNEYFKPPLPVSFEAMSKNHITNKVLEDKPAFKSSQHRDDLQDLLNMPGAIMVAHNAPYDIRMLQHEAVAVPYYICTQKVMQRLDPFGEEGPKNLQYLRYKHDLNELGATPHDALGDVMILKNLLFFTLRRGAEKANIEIDGPKNADNLQKLLKRFMQISVEPTLMARLPFGKYKGDLIAYCEDRKYLKWLVTDSSLDPDSKWTICKYHFPDLEPDARQAAQPVTS